MQGVTHHVILTKHLIHCGEDDATLADIHDTIDDALRPREEGEGEVAGVVDGLGCQRGGVRRDGAVEVAEFADKAQEGRGVAFAVLPAEVSVSDEVAEGLAGDRGAA